MLGQLLGWNGIRKLLRWLSLETESRVLLMKLKTKVCGKTDECHIVMRLTDIQSRYPGKSSTSLRLNYFEYFYALGKFFSKFFKFILIIYILCKLLNLSWYPQISLLIPEFPASIASAVFFLTVLPQGQNC